MMSYTNTIYKCVIFFLTLFFSTSTYSTTTYERIYGWLHCKIKPFCSVVCRKHSKENDLNMLKESINTNNSINVFNLHKCLDHDIDSNTIVEGETILTQVASNVLTADDEKKRAIEVLLYHRADPNMYTGETALEHAIKTKCVRSAEFLIHNSTNKALVGLCNNNGENALHFAAMQTNENFCDMFKKDFQYPDFGALNAKDEEGYTPLMTAAKYSNKKFIKSMLVKKSVKEKLLPVKTCNGESVITIAMKGTTKIGYFATKDAEAKAFCTALYLLKRGAPYKLNDFFYVVNCKPNWLPNIAIKSEIIKTILQQNNDWVNKKNSNDNGNTVLHKLAGQKGYDEKIIDCAISKSNINMPNDVGELPLTLALKNRIYSNAAQLLKQGSKYKQQDFWLAVKNDYADIVNLMLKSKNRSIKIDKKDHKDRYYTAVMKACVYDSPDVLKVLLDHGADITIINRSRFSIFDYDQKNKEVKNILDAHVSKLVTIYQKLVGFYNSSLLPCANAYERIPDRKNRGILLSCRDWDVPDYIKKNINCNETIEKILSYVSFCGCTKINKYFSFPCCHLKTLSNLYDSFEKLYRKLIVDFSEQVTLAANKTNLNPMDIKLWVISESGWESELKKIIKEIKLIDVKDPCDNNNTALIKAINLGHVAIAKILIEDGDADFYIKNDNDETAFDIGLQSSDKEIRATIQHIGKQIQKYYFIFKNILTQIYEKWKIHNKNTNKKCSDMWLKDIGIDPTNKEFIRICDWVWRNKQNLQESDDILLQDVPTCRMVTLKNLYAKLMSIDEDFFDCHICCDAKDKYLIPIHKNYDTNICIDCFDCTDCFDNLTIKACPQCRLENWHEKTCMKCGKHPDKDKLNDFTCTGCTYKSKFCNTCANQFSYCPKCKKPLTFGYRMKQKISKLFGYITGRTK